ncbi:MAG: XrtA system polysaccharide chain length determinant [Pseudomonadota bacterium]
MLSDYLLHALKYLRLVCSARKLVMPLVLFLCVAGWVMAFNLPNVYQSETQVYVDPRTMLDYLLEDLAVDNTDIEQDLVAVARYGLLTQSNLEKVAVENDLLLEVRSEIDKQIVFEELAKSVRISSQQRQGSRQGTQDLIISYRDINAERSKAVVNSFLDLFVNSVLRGSREDSERSESFLNDRIREYQQKLDDAEEQLKLFKSENLSTLGGEDRNFFQDLRSVSDRVNESRLALREAVQRRDELNSKYERMVGQSGSSSGSALRKAERIQELENQLDDLLLQFTDSHPDVIAAREQLRKLKRNFTPPELSGDNFGSQIALAEFALALSNAEADVASAQARLDEYSDRKETLTAAISTIPEIEAQERKLTRDYDVFKERYDELVERRETARLSREAGTTGNQVQFQVIEPPRTLPRPVEPNRPLLITLIFLGAWALGVAIPIMLDVVRPSVSSFKDIAKITDLPVLGTVSMTEASAAGLRVGMKTLLVFLILTTIAYATLAVLSLLPAVN